MTAAADRQHGRSADRRYGRRDCAAAIWQRSPSPCFSTKAKGMGLGLAITNAILAKISGKLEVESEVGKGSTFTVRLPVAKVDDAMNENRIASVLIVDDEVDACENLRDILTDLGYRVDTARNGLEAIERVRPSAYDIALLDLKMPGMDGVSVYRQIKRLRPETVAIVVSAFSGSDLAETAVQEGAAQVVAKPVDVPELLTCHRSRRSPNRWSWLSTTTRISARTSGIFFATAVIGWPWPTTRSRRGSSWPRTLSTSC